MALNERNPNTSELLAVESNIWMIYRYMYDYSLWNTAK